MSGLRVVTEQQIRDGFLLKVGGSVLRQDYAVIGNRGDGTYLVQEPRVEDLVEPLFEDRR